MIDREHGNWGKIPPIMPMVVRECAFSIRKFVDLYNLAMNFNYT
jgi:hypothetical protein